MKAPTLYLSLQVAGDKPELLYPQAQEELRLMGYETTLQYLKVGLLGACSQALHVCLKPGPQLAGCSHA